MLHALVRGQVLTKVVARKRQRTRSFGIHRQTGEEWWNWP